MEKFLTPILPVYQGQAIAGGGCDGAGIRVDVSDDEDLIRHDL